METKTKIRKMLSEAYQQTTLTASNQTYYPACWVYSNAGDAMTSDPGDSRHERSKERVCNQLGIEDVFIDHNQYTTLDEIAVIIYKSQSDDQPY